MRLYWVTNIPTPYRNHRYRTMARVFPTMGIEFEVLYMAETEPNRHWEMPSAQFQYPHTIFGGWHPVVAGVAAHFNPALLQRLRSTPPDVVLIGGFACPTHWLAPWFLKGGTTRVMMVESNLDSARMMGGASRWFKRRMILPNDAFVVPGPRSWDYVLEVAPEVRERPLFQLPNLVDEAIWVQEVAERRKKRRELREALGVTGTDQLWVCPARLVEEKGLDWFLPALEGHAGFRLLIAGDGPLRTAYESLVKRLGLSVVFLGPQNEDQMVSLYAAADLFVLPSVRDPSPLSAVEACAAGLPLLVSKRIGNYAEVLQDGLNGWTLEPEDMGRSREAIRAALESDVSGRTEMGRESQRIFAKTFDSGARVYEMGEFFLDVHGRHRNA